MEVYGTNCVKFAGCDLTLAAEWLRRELRIVEPKLVVVMGEDALEFLNGAGFPLAQPLRSKVGELQRFTPTIEALDRPRHRLLPRRGPCENRVLERLQVRWPLVGRLAALLVPLVLYYEVSSGPLADEPLVGRGVDRARADAVRVRPRARGAAAAVRPRPAAGRAWRSRCSRPC